MFPHITNDKTDRSALRPIGAGLLTLTPLLDFALRALPINGVRADCDSQSAKYKPFSGLASFTAQQPGSVRQEKIRRETNRALPINTSSLHGNIY